MTHTVVVKRRSLIRIVRERLSLAALLAGGVACTIQLALLAWIVIDAIYQIIAAGF